MNSLGPQLVVWLWDEGSLPRRRLTCLPTSFFPCSCPDRTVSYPVDVISIRDSKQGTRLHVLSGAADAIRRKPNSGQALRR